MRLNLMGTTALTKIGWFPSGWSSSYSRRSSFLFAAFAISPFISCLCCSYTGLYLVFSQCTSSL
jgi:hypothetical protein